MHARLRIGITSLLGALALAAGGTETASAFTTAPVWNCRASALSTSLAGNNRVEPVLANGNPNTANGGNPDRAQCAADDAGADNLATPLGIPSTFLTARTASAQTRIDPELGKAIDQKVGATARIENLQLPLGGSTVVLGATAAQSFASGQCVNNQPQLTGVSQVTGLTLGGQSATLDEVLAQIQKGLEPLGMVADIKFNEQVRDANSLTVRAAHIKLFRSAGMAPVADIIVAESRVVANQDVCNPDKQVPTTPGPTFNGKPCPPGSTYDMTSNLCLIVREGKDTIVVGRPFQGPSGGTAIALDEARRRFPNSPCVKGSGPKFAIVGTNGRDRITGTNKRDRILGLGGSDSLDGGRDNDCIDAGSGNDRASGGIGNDRLFGFGGRDTLVGGLGNDRETGGSGNDHLNGGSGGDTLDAGAGNDTVNGSFGADRITAGSGNDAVNIATQGPVARANCGSGTDKIRLNRKEVRRVRGCEIRYVLADR